MYLAAILDPGQKIEIMKYCTILLEHSCNNLPVESLNIPFRAAWREMYFLSLFHKQKLKQSIPSKTLFTTNTVVGTCGSAESGCLPEFILFPPIWTAHSKHSVICMLSRTYMR